ncbi:MAG: HAD family hydrolase [Myxococcota bacterium]
MPIRAVVFDLFDTLVDIHMDRLPPIEIEGRRFPSTAGFLHEKVREHADVSWEDFTQALIAVEREVRAPRAEQGRELPTLERFQEMLRRLDVEDAELAERLTEEHMRLVREQVTHHPHHVEVMEQLRGRVALGVCSNFSHSQTALAILEDAGLRWHFDAVLVSDATGWRKPRREIFDATCALLGVPPEETLHVGDHLRLDVAGGGDAGLRTAWLVRRIRDPETALREHQGRAPTHVIQDLAEVPGLVEREG